MEPVTFVYSFPCLNLHVHIHGLTHSKDPQTKDRRKEKEIGALKHVGMQLNLEGKTKESKPPENQRPTVLPSKFSFILKSYIGPISKSEIAFNHEGKVKSKNGRQDSEENKEDHNNDYEKKLDDLENYITQYMKQEKMELKECKERCAKHRIEQKKEMKEFYDNHVQNMQKIKDELERPIYEAENNLLRKKKKPAEFNEKEQRLNQDIPSLKAGKDGMNDEPEDCEYENYCLSYIWQVCMDLQANMYHIVLPDQFAENWLYKVKNIERDVEDEQLLDDQERKAASNRWEKLKQDLDWDPSLEKTLKMLKEEGNSMVSPECLTVEKAERAAAELNNKGRLRGRTSYEKVTKIIEMWRISTDLLKSGCK